MTHLKDVQPIRNQQQLEDMKWALKRHCSERDYILFVLGCETGISQARNPANFDPKVETK
jgi:hypothetical protein